MITISSKHLMLSSVAFAALVGATPAMAQDASANATADTAADNSAMIIVTAQKREQNAQDVPISLVAVTGESIERQGISSLQELGNSIAGVTILAGNPGAMRLAIRGASDLSSSNQSASVNGFYLDETAMSYVPGYMPEVSLADIERVEVLRGPQGTLFGEGSVGGTLRVITRKPDSQKFFGRVKLGAYATSGGGEGYAAQINTNIPIVQDVLAVSVAGGYRNLPGWIDIPDINVKNSNTSKLSDGRFALRYTPSTDFTLDLFYQISSKISQYQSLATQF
jgi:outer membrane receptor protein involved in Fe transport